MSSDIYFNVTSWFPGNVHVKRHFNTQCPLPRIFRPSYGPAYTVGEFTSFLIHLTMHSMFWVMINKSLNRQAANNKRMASSTFQSTKILSKIDRMPRGMFWKQIKISIFEQFIFVSYNLRLKLFFDECLCYYSFMYSFWII